MSSWWSAILGLCLVVSGTGQALVAGDADGSGTVDEADLSYVQNAILNGERPVAADINADELVDALDFQYVLLVLFGEDIDADDDGIPDGGEVNLGTNPEDPDTDGDGLTDGEEWFDHGSDPTLADTDGDGLSDGDEVNTHGSDPTLRDTDDDGFDDDVEVETHGTNPSLSDTDGDGWDDRHEVVIRGTDPNLFDTDDDGLSDPEEVLDHRTNPRNWDTDGDGLSDGDEVLHGSNPNFDDTDGDGISDGEEVHTYGTDPTLEDSDGDGKTDPQEIADGTDPALSDAFLLITEFLASNGDGIEDEDGNSSDWIEIHNPNPETIGLQGWHLTDDESLMTKWEFPPVNIAGGGYLVVFASGEDRKPVDGSHLHTNFSLSGDGEFLALVKQDGLTVTHQYLPLYPAQRNDISYGLYNSQDRYFAFPTPGAANDPGILGLVERPEFSVEHGFFESPFAVALSSDTDGATIRYTLDNSEPTAGNRTLYNPTSPIQVSETTTIRAKAFLEGYAASLSNTRTYIFLEDVYAESLDGSPPTALWPEEGDSVNGQRFNYGLDSGVLNDARYRDKMEQAFLDIPSVSIVSDFDNLFGSQSGIYVNARQDGSLWERPASVELIHPDGTEGFQINAGLRVRGGYSRRPENPKHAFRVFFRSEYGESSLKYPLFGNEGVEEFEKIDFRTAQNNSWSSEGGSHNTFLRDIFARDLQREIGDPYTRSRYYHLYLNGHYWGLFQSQERPEARYAASYFGGESDDYDVPKAGSDSQEMEVTDGNLDLYQELFEAMLRGWDDETLYGVQGLDPDGTRNPEKTRLLDVDRMIQYMLVIYYTGNYDAPVLRWGNNQRVHNFYSIIDRTDPDGFYWFVHDSEWSLIGESPTTVEEGLNYSRVGPFEQLGQFRYFNPQWLHQEMVSHPEYRMYFADMVHRHFHNGGVFTPDTVRRLFDARALEIDYAIIAESARWGDVSRSRDGTWMTELDTIRDVYLPFRNEVVVGQFRDVGWYPVTDAPVLGVNGTPQHGGEAAEGAAITLDNPNGGGQIYYTLNGGDPRERIYVESAGGGPIPPEEGGDSVFVAEDAAKRVLVPVSDIGTEWRGLGYDDSSWTSGSGGVGYDIDTYFDNYIDLDVEAGMYETQASCYVRIPFNVTEADLEEVQSLILNIRYEDGFVAFINGAFAAGANDPDELLWNSDAERQNADPAAINLVEFDASDALDALVLGENVLAIHGLNVSTTSSDFLISPELRGRRSATAGGGFTGPVSPDAVAGDSFALNGRTVVRARVLEDGEWSAMSEAVFSSNAPASAGSLVVTEINYHPAPPTPQELVQNNTLSAGDFEFVELRNIGEETIDLDGVCFSNGVRFNFDDGTILSLAPGDYVVVVDDAEAFTLRYGDSVPVAGEYGGNLNDNGEGIGLAMASGELIQDFSYSDGWFQNTDGAGFTLMVRDDTQEAALWDSKDGWRPSSVPGGTPGMGDDPVTPVPGAVVINELLAHSHDAAEDWIELHNTTGTDIGLGGWFLSDDSDELDKFEIPAGTVLPANGYVVLYEASTFGTGENAFALSENGETLYLSSGAGGELTGYSEEEGFDASSTGVSFGRYYKASTDSYNFVAMTQSTPGAANSAPLVGPIVISEIMYHPEGDADAEYIELVNISGAAVSLQDAETGETWQLSGGVRFQFPQGVSLAAGARMLLVQDEDVFNSAYPGVSVPVFAWESGRLNNAGERVQLSMPGDVDLNDVRHYIRVDRVVYEDVAPWPTSADGGGDALLRTTLQEYGNDVANWSAGAPTPGQ